MLSYWYAQFTGGSLLLFVKESYHLCRRFWYLLRAFSINLPPLAFLWGLWFCSTCWWRATKKRISNLRGLSNPWAALHWIQVDALIYSGFELAAIVWRSRTGFAGGLNVAEVIFPPDHLDCRADTHRKNWPRLANHVKLLSNMRMVDLFVTTHWHIQNHSKYSTLHEHQSWQVINQMAQFSTLPVIWLIKYFRVIQ